jgi:hypothetical protein
MAIAMQGPLKNSAKPLFLVTQHPSFPYYYANNAVPLYVYTESSLPPPKSPTAPLNAFFTGCWFLKGIITSAFPAPPQIFQNKAAPSKKGQPAFRSFICFILIFRHVF